MSRLIVPLALAALAVALFMGSSTAESAALGSIPYARPPPGNRTFVSPHVDALIEQLDQLWASRDLAAMFANCLPNTLDTTVAMQSGRRDTFVITGDIYAMWLRDSTNQVLPYVPYAAEDPALQDMLLGLLARQARSVNIDSYANAFNPGGDESSEGNEHQGDIRKPPMTPAVFEGKYEIDSLAAFLKLSYWYFRLTGDASFAAAGADDVKEARGTGTGTGVTNSTTAAGDSGIGSGSTWLRAVEKAIDTMAAMQHVGQSPEAAAQPYSFQRETTVATDTLEMTGLGPAGQAAAVGAGGLSRSLFRPSDDAVTLPYNIAGNAMACVELQHMETLLADKKVASVVGAVHAAAAADKVAAVAAGICGALEGMHQSLLADLSAAGEMGKDKKTKAAAAAAATGATVGAYPYEVDGFGSRLYMDDANVPSLLSLPLLGYAAPTDAVYQQTRRLVLSPTTNPFFFQGVEGAGVGGPHVGYGFAWPLAIAVRAMTSEDDDEVADCLQQLLHAQAGTGLMHESFNVRNASDFTRPWFAWANGLFGELLLQLVHQRPHLVLKSGAEVVDKARGLVQPSVSLLAIDEAKKKQKQQQLV